MITRDEILARIKATPSIPSAATRVIALVQNPDVDFSDVVRAIEFDPSLTSNVLRLANSAYFGGPRTIESLREAIVRLGLNRIEQLVLTSAVKPVASAAVRGYDLPPGDLLLHSAATAICTEQLASALNVTAGAFVFTAALLHDLGKIVLGTFLEIDAAPIVALAYEKGISFEKAEQEILGINHPEAGAMLLEYWELPSMVVEAVRCHHRPDDFAGNSIDIDLIHTADHLVVECGLGIGLDGLNYRTAASTSQRIHLRASQAESVLCRTLEGLEEVRAILFSTKGA